MYLPMNHANGGKITKIAGSHTQLTFFTPASTASGLLQLKNISVFLDDVEGALK
jgi:hypothetical protein